MDMSVGSCHCILSQCMHNQQRIAIIDQVLVTYSTYVSSTHGIRILNNTLRGVETMRRRRRTKGAHCTLMLCYPRCVAPRRVCRCFDGRVQWSVSKCVGGGGGAIGIIARSCVSVCHIEIGGGGVGVGVGFNLNVCA